MDRVQVIKRESASLGGDNADEAEYPQPIAPEEDALEAAGLYLQAPGARDETVLLSRASGKAVLKDADNATNSAITTEVHHRRLRQLIHFIEDGPTQGFTTGSFYEETSSLAPPFNTILPTDLIWWVSSAKTQKIVEKVITWDTANQRPTQILWRVYDVDGTTVLATVTDAYDYTGTFPTRTRTIS